MRTLLTILFIISSFAAFAEAQEFGIASVYSATFQGKRTASGELFNHNSLTAAHQKYPFGSLVKVTRIDNGKFVIVRINDRGPFVSRRVTDLSKAAALKLGMTKEKEEIQVKLELMNNRSMSELSQSGSSSQNKSNQPASTPPSQKVDNTNNKAIEEQAVLKEYKYAPSNKNRQNTTVQKKNLRL